MRRAVIALVAAAAMVVSTFPMGPVGAQRTSETITFDQHPSKAQRLDPLEYQDDGILWFKTDPWGDLEVAEHRHGNGGLVGSGRTLAPASCTSASCPSMVKVAFTDPRDRVDLEAGLLAGSGVSSAGYGAVAYSDGRQVDADVAGGEVPTRTTESLSVSTTTSQIDEVWVFAMNANGDVGPLVLDDLHHEGEQAAQGNQGVHFSDAPETVCSYDDLDAAFDHVRDDLEAYVPAGQEVTVEFAGEKAEIDRRIEGVREGIDRVDIDPDATDGVSEGVNSFEIDPADAPGVSMPIVRNPGWDVSSHFAVGQHAMIANDQKGISDLPLLWNHDTIVQVFAEDGEWPTSLATPGIQTRDCQHEIVDGQIRVLRRQGPGPWIPMDEQRGKVFSTAKEPPVKRASVRISPSLTDSVNFRVPRQSLDFDNADFRGFEVRLEGAGGQVETQRFERSNEPLLDSFITKVPDFHVHVTPAMEEDPGWRISEWFSKWTRNKMHLQRVFPIPQDEDHFHVHNPRKVGTDPPNNWGNQPGKDPGNNEYNAWMWEKDPTHDGCHEGGTGWRSGKSKACNSGGGYGGLILAQEVGHSLHLLEDGTAWWTVCNQAHSTYRGINRVPDPVNPGDEDKCRLEDRTKLDANKRDCQSTSTLSAGYIIQNREQTNEHVVPRFVNSLTLAGPRNGPPCLKKSGATVMSSSYAWVSDHQNADGNPISRSECLNLQSNAKYKSFQGPAGNTKKRCSYSVDSVWGNLFNYHTLRYIADCLGYAGFSDWPTDPNSPGSDGELDPCGTSGQQSASANTDAGETDDGPGLVVQGSIDRDGGVDVYESYVADAVDTSDPDGSGPTLSVHGVEGEVLDGVELRSFEQHHIDPHEELLAQTDSVTFDTAVPWDAELAREVRISQDDEVLWSRTVPEEEPAVELAHPQEPRALENGETVEVSWEASNPGEEPLSVQVLWSGDGGETWDVVAEPEPGARSAQIRADGLLGAPARGALQVRVGDGFHRADATIEGFSPAPKGPGLSIVGPAGADTGVHARHPDDRTPDDPRDVAAEDTTAGIPAGQTLELRALALDPNGGETTTTWSIHNEPVADGSTLRETLEPGNYTVRARSCTAGTDMCATDSLDLEVLPDADRDGLADGVEREHLLVLDVHDPTDPAQDPDDDGLTNRQELHEATDPALADTDEDGWTDAEELAKNTNPQHPDDPGLKDTDEDEVPDVEDAFPEDPEHARDEDHDGIPDEEDDCVGPPAPEDEAEGCPVDEPPEPERGGPTEVTLGTTTVSVPYEFRFDDTAEEPTPDPDEEPEEEPIEDDPNDTTDEADTPENGTGNATNGAGSRGTPGPSVLVAVGGLLAAALAVPRRRS